MIEETWARLKLEGHSQVHQRVSAEHPLDLYADYEHPNIFGMFLITDIEPAIRGSLKSVDLEKKLRRDNKWTLRMTLQSPHLADVFAQLCNDIIRFTENSTNSIDGCRDFLSRLEIWRSLLKNKPESLSPQMVKGLIGELLVLRHIVFNEVPLANSVSTWQGPLGAPQDFALPDGSRIEVKATKRDTPSVQINGAAQLDNGSERLDLVVVRLENAPPGNRASLTLLTLNSLIDELIEQLSPFPTAIEELLTSLQIAGWNREHAVADDPYALYSIATHLVTQEFPRLTRDVVPAGVDDLTYAVYLPPPDSSIEF